MKPEFEDLFRRVLEQDTHLTELDFRQANLSSEESQKLFGALEQNKTVTKLQFLGNNSSGVAAIALGIMLGINRTLEVLELGCNELKDEELKYIVSGLKVNTSVTVLDLNSNLFEGAGDIADLLEHNYYIKEIELTNSKINDAGFQEIFEALQKNEGSSLTTFSVYFPVVSCINKFNDFCNANSHRLEHTIRPF